MDEAKQNQIPFQAEAYPDKAGALLLAGSLLALTHNLLFYGQERGISVLLFLAIYYGLVGFLAPGDAPGYRRSWYLSLPILLLGACFALQYSPFFHRLNQLLLLGLLLVQGGMWARGSLLAWDEKGYFGQLFGFILRVIRYLGIAPRLILHRGKAGKRQPWSPAKRGIYGGLILLLPLLFVVGSLLVSADAVFARYTQELWQLFPQWRYPELAGRSIVFLLMFLGFTALFWCWRQPIAPSGARPAVAGPEASLQQPGVIAAVGEKGLSRYNPYMAGTILGGMGLLYLLFSLLQFSYLFAGAKLPEGINYAQYAREGFFQLCLVAAINFVVLLLTCPPAEFPRGRQRQLLRLLSTALVVFSIILLVSAHLRMQLYEATYGFTFLRVSVHYFMGYLALAFALGMLGIWRSGVPFFRLFAILSVFCYLGLNFFQVEKQVAQWNMVHYQKTGKIDVAYYQQLSYNGVPELVALAQVDDPVLAYQAGNVLYRQWEEMKEDDFSWQSYNLTRWHGRQSLQKATGVTAAARALFDEFDQQRWQRYPEMRHNMANSLLQTTLKPGMSQQDLAALLGPAAPSQVLATALAGGGYSYANFLAYPLTGYQGAESYSYVDPDLNSMQDLANASAYLVLALDEAGNYRSGEIMVAY